MAQHGLPLSDSASSTLIKPTSGSRFCLVDPLTTASAHFLATQCAALANGAPPLTFHDLQGRHHDTHEPQSKQWNSNVARSLLLIQRQHQQANCLPHPALPRTVSDITSRWHVGTRVRHGLSTVFCSNLTAVLKSADNDTAQLPQRETARILSLQSGTTGRWFSSTGEGRLIPDKLCALAFAFHCGFEVTNTPPLPIVNVASSSQTKPI